jgi:hypothetical protein
VTAIDAVVVTIMRHLRFLFFVTTSKRSRTGTRPRTRINYSRSGFLERETDVTSIVMESLAASQSAATTTARIERETRVMTSLRH